MTALWIAALALADAPADLRPVMAPMDAPEQYAEYARSEGRSDVLACEPVWPRAALMCWRRGSGAWVTRAELRTWETTHSELLTWATAQASERLKAGWTAQRTEGIEGLYFTAPDPDGWAHAAVLVPSILSEVTGSEAVYVAAPVDGVLLVWAPGHAQLDHVIAVGVHKLYDQQAGPVTPIIHRYDGQWSAFAEAKPRSE